MSKNPPEIKNIDHIIDISYKDFFTNYLLQNKPCILLQNSICEWNCCKKWVTNCHKPDFEYLEKNFGSTNVPVSNCNVQEYNSQKKFNMKMAKYLQYWKKQSCDKLKSSSYLYLKDWHFCRDFPDYDAYNVPIYFESDWLNEYCKLENDDYQFVYMGPEGTWTPLHADVFGSYSWSANVCGRKKWVLFPFGTEKLLYNENNKLVYSIDEISHSSECLSVCLEVIQHPGEIIFVPSGWYHQVWNLDDCISINHNWFNGCNISHIWNCLTIEAEHVSKEIADCKDSEDWEKLCEIVLKAHHGMNYDDFLKIINCIGTARLNCDVKSWHDKFDIAKICEVLNTVQNALNVPNFIKIKAEEIYDKVKLHSNSSDNKEIF